MRWLLALSQRLLLVSQPLLWMSGESPSAVTIGLLAADLYALWWLLSSRRLQACFRKNRFNGTFADRALQHALNKSERTTQS